MSWSVSRKGSPVEVKEQLAQDFVYAKRSTASVPTENEMVVLAEQIVNKALDQMIESGYSAVNVTGWGSGCNTHPDKLWLGNSSFNLVVSPLPITTEATKI